MAQSWSTEFFIDSHTGAIIGTRETPTILGNIRSLHTSLWLGKTGRNLVGIATGISVWLIVSGIYLWWPVRRTGTARGLMFYLHYALGIYFSLFLLLLSLTGLVMTFDWAIGPWAFRMTQSTPPKWDAPSTVVPGAVPIDATHALDVACSQLPEARPLTLILPSKPQSSYAVNLRYPGDSRECRVLVDQYSGKILSVLDARHPPGGVRIMSINGGIHTGSIWGLPSQVVMSLASLVLVLQTVTGYWLWWKKLRRKPVVSA